MRDKASGSSKKRREKHGFGALKNMKIIKIKYLVKDSGGDEDAQQLIKGVERG